MDGGGREYAHFHERVCVCERDLWHFKVVVLSYPLPSPCVAFCQSQPSDIFRQLNSGTFQCHPLLSFLTATAQTMMHSHCGGKMIYSQPQGLPGSKLFFHCSIKLAFAGTEYHSLLWWKTKKMSFSQCNMYSRIEKKSDKTLVFDICYSLRLMQIWGISAILTFPTKHNSQLELLFFSAKSKITKPKKIKNRHRYFLTVHHIAVCKPHRGLFNCPRQNQIGLVPEGVYNCTHLIHKSGTWGRCKVALAVI